VSLVPSATGILIALDQLDNLVGRTDYDTRPEVSHLPSVGGGLEPSIERIVSLRPDLVLRFRAESDLATPRQLDEAGIDHVAIRPDGISDVHRIIGLLGTITGRGEAADSIRRELADGVEQVSERVAGADRPAVALLLGGDPPLVAGGGTFLHELIEIAGGRNVFSDLRNLYAPVNVEEVIRRDPELLLIREGAAVPGALSRFAVVRLPPEVETPGLELVESAHLIAGFFHPDRVP
jgi:ABC-type Fe3+-hydroxamate transport system substrate-binding protein